MRQSKLFSRTLKEAPKDEVSVNAQLLARGGFISKLMAGVHTFLPLGFRVREKVIGIIREEMNALGASELLMPALHPRAAWDATGRWESMKSVMYQFRDLQGKEYGLGPTHEEIVAAIGTHIIFSYADLPISTYQIQTKFRSEARAKSGLMRGREFSMKDLYSFHADEQSLAEFYEVVKHAYLKVFKRMELTAFVTEASGGDFSKEHSHEFMVETSAGEDETVLCRLCGYAENKEISKLKSGATCPKCPGGVVEHVATSEVGNIFKLGTRFSEPLNLRYRDAAGALHPVIMASYGIGVDRLVGTIVEVHHDDRGIVWPRSVAPAAAHLVVLGEDEKVRAYAEKVYEALTKKGMEVLFDDRHEMSAGEKFTDADLIGIPARLVVSEKTLAHNKVEVKERKNGKPELVALKDLPALLGSNRE
ncbi:MAG: aminoacyl--tRNA ligase-related protein [bacterium]|nr:aminoacyl--tRNA ligase-related protein [bacterium]